MNDAADNVIIRNILLDAASSEFAEELSNSEPVANSVSFQRQMRRMMANPTSWAKLKRRPVWKRTLQTAAVILLACSITLGSIMVASPNARAAIIEWVIEWYENSIIYRFFGEPVFEDMPRYQIVNLPSGYCDTEEHLELPNNTEVTYENENGDMIRFEYMRVEEGSAIVMDTENMEISEIEINKCFGHLYMSQDPQQSSFITWYDDIKGIQFVIDGFFDKVALVSMAESVSLED